MPISWAAVVVIAMQGVTHIVRAAVCWINPRQIYHSNNLLLPHQSMPHSDCN